MTSTLAKDYYISWLLDAILLLQYSTLIEYNVIRGKGCIKDELIKYSADNREILFVVVESSDGLSINCNKNEEHIIAESWKNLKCPLVVVSEMQGT